MKPLTREEAEERIKALESELPKVVQERDELKVTIAELVKGADLTVKQNNALMDENERLKKAAVDDALLATLRPFVQEVQKMAGERKAGISSPGVDITLTEPQGTLTIEPEKSVPYTYSLSSTKGRILWALQQVKKKARPTEIAEAIIAHWGMEDSTEVEIKEDVRKRVSDLLKEGILSRSDEGNSTWVYWIRGHIKPVEA